jgi:peptidoglycan/xylan/chitin deacetylase (PgdA/CDA1 family)
MVPGSIPQVLHQGRRAAILTYHSLDETGSVISISPSIFQRQMKALAATRTPVVPLSQIRSHPGAVAITFDDGFVSFAEHAVPILQHFSLPATVFVVSGYCGGYNDWSTQRANIPRLPLMSWSLLRDLPPTISVGAHTVTHPDLRSLKDRDMAREICQSRVQIEQETGRPVESFAYPYGAVDARIAALVRQEFGVGCGTRLQFITPDSDPAVQPRLDVYYLKSPLWWRHPVGTINRSYIAFRRCLRTVRDLQRGS